MNMRSRTDLSIGTLRLLALLLVAAHGLLTAAPAEAEGGLCKWEGGPGVAGGQAACAIEDCIGNGGNARCEAPKPAPPAGVPEGLLGPGNWVYNMCDEQPAHMANVAKWCTSADGTWYVSPGWNTECRDLPPDILGSGGGATSSEDRAVSISDKFVGLGGSCGTTLQSDTGWGTTIGPNSFCWSGGSDFVGSLIVNEKRQRHYEHQACQGGIKITMMRQRGVECPKSYRSRTSNGALQCYLPGETVCPVANPVSPTSGAKLQVEVDYRPSGASQLEFVRRYSSIGRYRPTGLTMSGIAAADEFLADDYWRHNYDRRLHLVTGNAQLLAVAHREDGSVRSFDQTGRQIENRTGAGDKLASASGGNWQLTLANRSVETYSSTGRLLSIRSSAGQLTTMNYNGNGKLGTVTGPFGHELQFAYDTSGRLTSLTLPDNSVIQYGYDTSNRLTNVTYPDTTSKTYHYEDNTGRWLLTGITDQINQRYSTYTYDTSGRVTVSEHAGGAERYEFAYSATTPVTTMKDPDGATRVLSFVNAAGIYKAGSSSLPGASCGIVKAATYDTDGNIASKTDFNDNQSQFTFDPLRNLEISRTEAVGTPRERTVTTQWHPTFHLPTQIDESDRRTSFTYDLFGNVLTRSVTDLATNQTRTSTYTYNAKGQVLTIDGPRTDVNDVTTYTYHECTYGGECGQIVTVQDAAGHTTTYLTYGAHGQPLTLTDANNTLITLAYDSRQRLISREVGGELTQMSYYDTGLLKRVTAPDASYLEYTYDVAHRLTRVEDGDGNRITYTLDAAGNRTVENVYDPSQALARMQGHLYDVLGRLLSDVDSDNNTVAYTYDLNGNMDSVIDQEFRQTTNGYDELNRLTSTVDPVGGLVQYDYTARDELQAVTDARSLTTSYQYNGFGDLTQLDSPDTGVTQYARDAAGNLHQSTDARSKSATYAYDALGRVTQVLYSDQTITFAYDQGTSGKGALTQVTDASGSTSWTYTAHGRVAGKVQLVGSQSFSVGYGHNAAGQLSQLTTPSGQVIGYSYGNGRPSAITINGTALLSGVLYSPFGPTRGWNWANATLAVREYDLDGRIVTIDSAGLSTYSFFNDGTIQSWSDDAGALPAGPAGLTQFVVDSDSNQLSSSSGLEVRTYQYDAAGNITSDGTRSFAYNDAGRMISATSGGTTVTYALNGLGQRVRKTAGSESRYFVYDEAGHLLGEYGNGGTLIQETVWLGDIPVAVLQPNGSGGVNVFYVHTDHLNTPRRISRPSDNAILWRWDADPFGTSAANEDPDGDNNLFAYHLRFPGQYFDPETGLHYNYMRDGYDPASGRYTQSDPIGLKGGLNTYAYVNGNPILLFDSLGLKVEVRCRSVGNPSNMSFRAMVAAAFGGEHCFLVVSCETPKQIPETTISYPSSATVTDSKYSNIGAYRPMTVFPPASEWKDGQPCPTCEFEQCILNEAIDLQASNYHMSNYDAIRGPNSNSFAKRLVEKCGGVIRGTPPPTGWQSADQVGF